MKEIVKRQAKAFLLLALCVAVAASAVPATAVWADEATGEAGSVTEPSGHPQPGEEPGGADTGEKPDGEKESGSADTGEEPGTGKELDDGSIGEEPDSGEEKPEGGDEPEKVTVVASVRMTKSGNAAYISWKRVEGAYAYRLQRSSKKDSGFRTIASISETAHACKDGSVKKGSRYYYRVAAKMEDGRTCYSEAVTLSCPLDPVSGVKLVRYSSSSIKVTWNLSRDANAAWYKVYYAKKKNGKYKLAGTTKNNWFRVKNLADHQRYYFRVEACVSKKSSGLDSNLSKAAAMTTKPYERLTVFAGDSITTGLTSYGTVNKINIGGKKKVVAAIGLNTITFRTKRVFGGLSATQSIVRDKPYRVYIMLGSNDIHYRRKKDVVDGYREVLKAIRSGSPDTDIVVLAVAPVTATTKERRTGFKQIPSYNQDLKALAEHMGVKFYDCTEFMKDSTGWLKSSYAAGDGIHWKSSVYDQYAKLLAAYDKSLD